MKDLVLKILDDYLVIYPEEKQRQKKFKDYLLKDIDITDWNNFAGHLVAGAFIYAKHDKKLLLMYHNDLKMYLYPGGHIDKNDKSPLEAALREVYEETGLDNLKIANLGNNDLIPIDIDTQFIEYNKRLSLPGHYHYDFRYLFIIDEVKDITIDTSELSDYKWVDYNKALNMPGYANIKDKLNKIIQNIM